MVGRSSLEAVILVRIQFPQPNETKTPIWGLCLCVGLNHISEIINWGIYLFVNLLYDLNKYQVYIF